jgi:LIM domain kinase 1
MAPEMLRGNKYDEKVDVFSFGIIMCEIIGRVQADPDFMPRTDDFGLNRQQFVEVFCNDLSNPCPEIFYKIAFLCCDLNPDRRPSFKTLQEWFDRITIHCAIIGNFHSPLPVDLAHEINNFHGEENSTCNTPEISQCTDAPKFTIESPKDETDSLSSPEKDNEVPEIIKRTMSPHHAREFMPNGDRIRDSWRARRKQKIRENRQRVKKDIAVTESIHKKSAVANT